MLRSLSDSIFSLAYPQDCKDCEGPVEHADDGIVCTGCWEETTVFDGHQTLCCKCGAFLFGAPRSSAFSACRKCDEHHYDSAAAVGLYEKALSASVLRLKRVPHIPKRIRGLLSATLERMTVAESPLVVPVPLSPRRLHERGFNQASVIGRFVAQQAGLDVDENSFIRKVHTPMHRAGMDKKARAVTVRNAFAVTRSKLIEGRDVLLVDDILTSGETASSCAKVLKENGATTVRILTIARAA